MSIDSTNQNFKKTRWFSFNRLSRQLSTSNSKRLTCVIDSHNYLEETTRKCRVVTIQFDTISCRTLHTYLKEYRKKRFAKFGPIRNIVPECHNINLKMFHSDKIKMKDIGCQVVNTDWKQQRLCMWNVDAFVYSHWYYPASSSAYFSRRIFSSILLNQRRTRVKQNS